MKFPVIAVKRNQGIKKSDGKPYDFSSIWIQLDDGGLYEVRAQNVDYREGDIIELFLVSFSGNLQLRFM